MQGRQKHDRFRSRYDWQKARDRKWRSAQFASDAPDTKGPMTRLVSPADLG
jgi:hypothetical protein